MPSKLMCLLLAACLLPGQVRAKAESDENAVSEAVELIRSEAGSHRMILLGELHGTREIPMLAASLVSAYAAQGPVLLGLEVHYSEHNAIRRYLSSNGGQEARDELRSSAFWKVDGVQHDGRRSLDALDLIDHVRLLRAQGRDVAVFPFDNASNRSIGSQARDKAMGNRLRVSFRALHGGRLLVLTGNVHAMLERPSYAPPEMQTPMGEYLRDRA